MTEIASTTTKNSKPALGPIRRWARTLKWWPSFAGAAAAAIIAFDLSQGQDLAPVLTAAALVYLGAAALQKKGSSWPLFFLSLLLGGLGSAVFDVSPAWVLIPLAGPLLVYGIMKDAVIRPLNALPLQTLAMMGFSTAAVVALAIEPTAGSYLVAVALFAHAGWDVYHHWTDRVVSRSLSEFCFVLDTVLGIIIIVAAT